MKLEKRRDEVSSANYLFELIDKIKVVQMLIDKTKKVNKEINLENDKKGKNLNDIENVHGVPESVKETHEVKTEISFLERKNQVSQHRINEIEKELEDIKAKLPEVEEKLDKMKILANHYHIVVDEKSKQSKKII